jgi:hypothetical protein
MESSQTKSSPSLDGFAKRSTASRKRSTASTPSITPQRPIATNSKIKQDEQLRKDMYLAFVNNALHQKSLVRHLRTGRVPTDPLTAVAMHRGTMTPLTSL